jgi:DNA-binding CsgD family transcriptional regulator
MTHHAHHPSKDRNDGRSRADVWTVRATALRHRGSAKQLRELFERTLIPMLWVDNRRRNIDANAASRLFLRRTLIEIRHLSVDDLFVTSHIELREERWSAFLRRGTTTGSSAMRASAGSTIAIDYSGVANLLPGAHLFVWMPSAWSPEELGDLLDEPPPPRRGRLSPRERDVLRVLATGASIDEIGEELAVSPHTVKTHLRNAMRHLGARHRAHAIAIALSEGEI